jgi:hypothetical protein
VSSLHSKKIIALQKPLKVSPEKSYILSCDTVVLSQISDIYPFTATGKCLAAFWLPIREEASV